MPTLGEERARIKHLLKTGRINDETRVKVVIPSIDVHERIRNERKIRRIVIQTDEVGVSEYAAIKEAWIREMPNQNPSMYFSALIESMKTFNVRGWVEEQEESKHVLGKD